MGRGGCLLSLKRETGGNLCVGGACSREDVLGGWGET